MSLAMETMTERVRLRIREEMTRKHLSTRDIAGILEWSQSRVAKVINGRVGLNIDDAAQLAFAVSISLVEAVRDRGLEFHAEMDPMELRILQRLRQMPVLKREAILNLLDIGSIPVEHRGATKRKPIFGNPRQANK